MTTIAWDGRTLAADRCAWSGGARSAVYKLLRVRGSLTRFTGSACEHLVAFSGSGDFASALGGWLSSGAVGDGPRWQDFIKDDDRHLQCTIVVAAALNPPIVPQRYSVKLWRLSNQLVWTPIHEDKFAMGAGQEFAWGALEAGATAQQAVEIAAKRSDYAGLGVDTLEF